MSYKDFDLGALEVQASGMDSFLGEEEADIQDLRDLVAGNSNQKQKVRVANVTQLSGFTRVASDTLIRKSERDLWSLTQSEDGDWIIERLFDEDGKPLKV